MSTKILRRRPILLTEGEAEVMQALKQLEPHGYCVHMGGAEIPIETGDRTHSFEPDFIVESPDGRRLFVEVKAAQALSLENIAMLTLAGRQAKSQGHGLLVFVPDAVPEYRRSSFLKSEDGLKVEYADNATKVVPSVLEAFRAADKD